MKRMLIVLVALLAMIAFVGGVMAQEKKAQAPAPAPAPEKAKAEKPKAPKAMKASGTIAAYEAGKMIKVKAKDKDLTFDIAADAKIKGEPKEGAKVTVMYKKDGDKMVATSISVAAAKKPKAEKKERPAEKK
jgi:Na+-transporting methylmalonyl-CoA/oxaloacetate decarboxylase gamma subunit